MSESTLTDAELGSRVRAAIEAAGKTQEQVADWIGMDPTALSRALAGKRRLSSLELARICSAVEADPSGLLQLPPQLRYYQLEDLLAKAHAVVTWTTQGTVNYGSAGGQHLLSARREYMKARIDACAAVRQLTPDDIGGCTCGWHKAGDHNISPECLYHYAAALQPGNHQIPWNCPTYFDGCNCGDA